MLNAKDATVLFARVDTFAEVLPMFGAQIDYPSSAFQSAAAETWKNSQWEPLQPSTLMNKENEIQVLSSQ